jgi:serine/threonine protein kinase
MFSLGAVFYEFLTYRPAFPGDDPIQILEQLRSEDPPPLPGLDASIPPDLADAIARAMRKDRSQRFPDLADMHATWKTSSSGAWSRRSAPAIASPPTSASSGNSMGRSPRLISNPRTSHLGSAPGLPSRPSSSSSKTSPRAWRERRISCGEFGRWAPPWSAA